MSIYSLAQLKRARFPQSALGRKASGSVATDHPSTWTSQQRIFLRASLSGFVVALPLNDLFITFIKCTEACLHLHSDALSSTSRPRKSEPKNTQSIVSQNAISQLQNSHCYRTCHNFSEPGQRPYGRQIRPPFLPGSQDFRNPLVEARAASSVPRVKRRGADSLPLLHRGGVE